MAYIFKFLPVPRSLLPCIILLCGIMIGISIPIVIGYVKDPKWGYTFLFCISSIIFILLERRRYHSWTSPVILMTLGWLPLLILHNLQLSPRFNETLTYSTWNIILFSFIGFCGASLFLCYISSNKQKIIKIELLKEINPVALKRIIYVYFLLGLGIFVFNVINRGGFNSLPIFSGLMAIWGYYIPVVGQFVLLMDIAVIWSVLYWCLFGLRNSYDLIFIVAAMIIRDLLMFSRGSTNVCIFFGIILFILIYQNRFRSKKIVKKTIIWISILLFSMFLIFQLKSYWSDQTERSRSLVETGAVQVPHYSLAYPYIYLTNSITNLQLNTEGNFNLSMGLRSFGAILSMLQIKEIDTRPNYISNWSGGIIPYQGTLFLDFGLNGVIFGSIVLGCLCGWLFSRVISHPTGFYLVTYSIIAPCILTSAITNWFALGRTLYVVIGSLGLYGIILIAKTKNRSG